jgi:hypothetical protein
VNVLVLKVEWKIAQTAIIEEPSPVGHVTAIKTLMVQVANVRVRDHLLVQL